MGLFSQRKDEENTWAALPGEPLDQDAVDALDDSAGAVDPLEVGLGAQTASVAFPVAPPAPEESDTGDAEPKDTDPSGADPSGADPSGADPSDRA